MPADPQQLVTDPIELHRRYWSEGLDLEVIAVTIALVRASEAMKSTGRHVFARHDLTPAEFDLLATLRRSPPPYELTPSDIQQMQVITSGGLTKVMSRLQARNLVSRPRHDADQRVRPVRLSAAGKRLVEKTMAELMAESPSLRERGISRAEAEMLMKLLGKVAGRPPG